MKLLSFLLGITDKSKKAARKTIEDYKREVLVRQGRAEFEKLMQKGISVPIALL